MKPLFLICVSVLLLTGCGQKGDLYLPSSEQGVSQSTPAHHQSSNEVANE